MVCIIEQAVCVKGWLIKKSSYYESPALLHIQLEVLRSRQYFLASFSHIF